MYSSTPVNELFLCSLEQNVAVTVHLICLYLKNYAKLQSANEQLFDKIHSNSNHVLSTLLPPPSLASQNYNLRRRSHTLTLPAHNTRLSDCNFITRLLYKECRNMLRPATDATWRPEITYGRLRVMTATRGCSCSYYHGL